MYTYIWAVEKIKIKKIKINTAYPCNCKCDYIYDPDSG